MRKYIDIAYLLAIGATIGLVLGLGIIVAPVVFHADIYTGVELTHYQMGLVMTEIFLRSNYWLNTVAIAIVLYEGYEFKSFRRDRLALPSAATAVLMIFLFTLYYTKAIVAYQRMGESVVNDPTFEALHKGSEIDFMLLALSLVLLFTRRLYLLTKG